jgi:hypothetical protein
MAATAPRPARSSEKLPPDLQTQLEDLWNTIYLCCLWEAEHPFTLQVLRENADLFDFHPQESRRAQKAAED